MSAPLAFQAATATPVSIATQAVASRKHWTTRVEFIAENGGGAGVRLRKSGGPHDEGKRPEELNSTNDD